MNLLVGFMNLENASFDRAHRYPMAFGSQLIEKMFRGTAGIQRTAASTSKNAQLQSRFNAYTVPEIRAKGIEADRLAQLSVETALFN